MNIRTQTGIYKRDVSITHKHIVLNYHTTTVPNLISSFLDSCDSISKYIPKLSVSEKTITREIVSGNVLYRSRVPLKEKEKIKNQILKFVVLLNQSGWAHRDLHTKNILWNGETIKVIDWEFVYPNAVPLKQCYDLTGKGLPSPLNSGNMNVFSNNRASISTMFNIKMKDFLQCQKNLQI